MKISILLIYGILFFAPQTKAELIEHGPKNLKQVALTFDACYNFPSEFDSAVAEELISTKTPATIFMSGKWAEKLPAEAKLLASQPFLEIGSHSYTHPHLTTFETKKIQLQLQASKSALKKVLGITPKYFRPPFGEYNDEIVKEAQKLGMATIQFSIASGDPDPNLSSKRIVKYVVNSAQNGSIILMHINKHGWKTAESLPEIINGLKARNFELVTVGTLLKHADKKFSP